METIAVKTVSDSHKVLMDGLESGKSVYLDTRFEWDIGTVITDYIVKISSEFPKYNEDDISEENKGGPYALILCGDDEEVARIHSITKSQTSLNVGVFPNPSPIETTCEKTKKKYPIFIGTVSGILSEMFLMDKGYPSQNLRFVAFLSGASIVRAGLERYILKIANRIPQCQLFVENTGNFSEDVMASLKCNYKIVVDEKPDIQQQVSCLYYKPEAKGNLIASIIQRNKGKKIAFLFLSSEEAVFFQDVMSRLELVDGYVLNNTQTLNEQIEVITQFNEKADGVMFSAQERKFKNVDLAIFVDPPKELLNVRYPGAGNIILFGLESEKLFFEKLGEKRTLKTIKMVENQLNDYSPKIEQLVAKQYFVHVNARTAYQRFLQNYVHLDFMGVFGLKRNELIPYAHSFGLTKPVKTNLANTTSKEVPDVPVVYEKKVFVGSDATVSRLRDRQKELKNARLMKKLEIGKGKRTKKSKSKNKSKKRQVRRNKK
ncbi:hypothetical protein EIN_405020 [Entamoeba invadens IP1]|uniref:Uncharacterized protein n=1 Tax=Entamoeba invadens IP1 TaxID=370355 RepID=A0A0A1U6P4_ENTIV|nr:hypothetical protein EIN_405020 [Entamoeba invadens IP1]ELP90088.1 hypothetical protein EIN_405020 [Entamoeba invadens IP1]|eukprot:XP_004256859.1 hypothetical protein EIN_405020 [Entamoeba invadens IP1]